MPNLFKWVLYKLACIQLWLVNMALSIALEHYADGHMTKIEFDKTTSRLGRYRMEALNQKVKYGN